MVKNPYFFLNRNLNRKDFLTTILQQGIFVFCSATAFSYGSYSKAFAWLPTKNISKKGLENVEAKYYKKLDADNVQCLLCPHKCEISPGERGLCGVRENQKGKYYTLTYNRPCSLHVDPIEKKPLFHVFPGARVFSLATVGCNLQCSFCQNWQISQARPDEVESSHFDPYEIIQKVIQADCRFIAYTYSEPTVFYEYMFDIASRAHDSGIINTCHSNGFINPKPLARLLEIMDAANIDLKGFTSEFYTKVCGGELDAVLKSLKQIKKSGTHLEITNLIVPTKNDQPKKIKEMCKWIKNELGPDVPIHFSRFYPNYKLKNLPPTPVKTLNRAREIAIDEGLFFVYIGNLQPGYEAENTYCFNCHKMIIERRGYSIKRIEMKDGKCNYCGQKIPGLWG